VRKNVTAKLEGVQRNPANRYFDGSPLHAARFTRDWNRSYVLEPDGPPVGVVVLLHGLTDSPYSLRHVARHYRDRGGCARHKRPARRLLRLPGEWQIGAMVAAERARPASCSTSSATDRAGDSDWPGA
jgi:hypothetical protein